MATQSGRPPDNGPAARLQETRRSRSSQFSRALVVTLATVAAAAVIINGRFHENTDAKVAPCAQFLRDETIGMGADAAHRVAFGHSGFTTRNVSAQTELVTQRGHDQCNASSAGSFTASSSSTNSSPIASGLITWKSAIFDKRLITSSSKVSQNRIVDGDIEMIEGGEGFRVQCLDVQRLPLRFDTSEGNGCKILCDPLHIETTEGKESREILYAPLQVETTTEGRPLEVLHASPHEILFRGRRVRAHEVLPFLHSGPIVLDEGAGHNIEGGGEFRLQRSSCRVVQHLPLLPPLLNAGPVVLDERGGHEVLHPSAAAVVLHFPPLHAELIGGEGTLNVSSSFPASEKGVTVYFLASEHPPSSTGGDQEAHSPAASAAVNGGSERFSSAYDESWLTALTATGCSYASAFDSGKAGGTMVCDRDVTMILNSSVLNAACGTPASVRHGVKGTLSPGCVQSIVPHRHGDRKTSTSVSSQRSYSSRYDLLLVQLPLTDPSTRLVRFCRLLSPCFDGMRPFLTSFNPVLRPLDPHLHEILLLCVPASPTWGGGVSKAWGGRHYGHRLWLHG